MFLERRTLLLGLDNFEHLLAAAALVSRLLGDSPGLACWRPRVLRCDWRASGSTGFRRSSRQRRTSSSSCGRKRRRTSSPSQRRTGQRSPTSASVSTGSRSRSSSPPRGSGRSRREKLLERLGERLPLLTQALATRRRRQQTLRATIDWSYSLLAAEEQSLLARLSVFAGGCTLEAAEAVCDAHLDTLASLVEQSLLREDDVLGEPRYSLLETVREYALERLRERGEEDACRHRHAAYFLALAEQAEPALFGPTRIPWLDRLEPELDNLRRS